MEIKPIVTKADHRAALKQIEALMSARPGTPDGDRLDVLVTLVEAWEKKRYPMAGNAALLRRALSLRSAGR